MTNLLKNRGWTWYLVPINASTSGLATILPLYMIQLGGTVKEIALSVFISGLASTIGSIFWGKIIDRMQWRRIIILISSISIIILAASIYFISSVAILIAISAIISYLTAGIGPVTNLLVKEKSKNGSEWIKIYSWTSLITCAGIVIAMVVGFAWLQNHDIRSYAIICSVIGAISLGLALLLLRDPPGKRDSKKNNQIIHWSKPRILSVSVLSYQLQKIFTYQKLKLYSYNCFASLRSLLLSLISLHFDFPRCINRSFIADKLIQMQKSTSKKEFLFFGGISLYYLSGNLLFTPYTPFLKQNGVSDSEVFLAYTILHLSKVVFLPFNHKTISKNGGEEKMARWSYIPRASGILMILIASIFLVGNQASILIVTFIAFIAVDIAYSIWDTSTTCSLFRIMPRSKEGSLYGINSSIIGAGNLIGAIAAGAVSASFGYGTTFALAVIVVLISLILVSKSFTKTNDQYKFNSNYASGDTMLVNQ
jgi:predicted MFS family arabinose efflux permease